MKKLTILFICLFLSIGELFSQNNYEYWFGIPAFKRSGSEALRGSETNTPLEVWITAQEETKVILYDRYGEELFSRIIGANTSYIYPLSEDYINEISEQPANKGLRLVSEKPVSVSIFLAYKWTGEAVTIFPKEYLGTEYYTMNFYQDKMKFFDGSTNSTAGAILIVAAENDTRVTITPKVDTEAGHLKNSPFTVNLLQGQTYLIKSKIMENMDQTWETDLTGTYISSTKPISVFSGHTKVAFPRLPSTFMDLKSDYMRTPFMDMQLPFHLAGQEYISIPIKYIGRTNNYAELVERNGDIIRFIALEDNTSIYQMNKSGTKLNKLATINKGKEYKIMEQTDAAYYYSSKKVLVSQFGKVYAQAFSQTAKTGQGMMMTLLPSHLWTSSTSFNSSTGGVSNYLNLIFKTKDVNNIFLDGRSIKDEFGSAIFKLNGTPYSYVSGNLARGRHFLSSNRNTVRFGAYFYGNLDSPADGFAYGSFAGVYADKSCDDSLYFEKSIDCNIYKINSCVYDLDNFDCAEIKSVTIDSAKSYNYYLIDSAYFDGKKERFRDFAVDDKSAPAYAEITAETFSGIIKTESISFTPDIVLSSNINQIDFGLQDRNNEVKHSIMIKNITQDTIEIKKFYFKNGTQEFSVNYAAALKLNPNEEKEIEIRAFLTDNSRSILNDTLIADFDCFANRITSLKIHTAEPFITANNIVLNNLSPFCDEHQITAEIKNEGAAPAVIDTITFTNSEDFILKSEGLFPFTIQPAETKVINNIFFNTQHRIDYSSETTVNIICTNPKTNASFEIKATSSPSIFSLSDKDWGNCTINHDNYPADINFLNCCDPGEVKIKEIFLSGDEVFEIDSESQANIMSGSMPKNEARQLRINFSPKDTGEFKAKLIVKLEKCDNILEVESDLIGYGVLPSSVLEKAKIQAQIIPNPASDYTKLKYSLTESSDNVKIELYDSMGALREVIYKGYSDKEDELIISPYLLNLTNGAYTIRISSGGEDYLLHFVLLR